MKIKKKIYQIIELCGIFNILFLVTIFVIIFSGCKVEYEKIEFTDKNPTNYCYDYSLDKVKNAIKLEFENFSYCSHKLYFKENVLFYETGSELFEDYNNRNDALLAGDNFYCKSFIYFKNSIALEYESVYQIHVSSSSENKTCLEIITINPRIKIGIFRTFTPQSMSFKGPKYISVEPSTIEEYEILYLIGKRLGQKNMPNVKYPSPNAIKTNLHYYSITSQVD